MKAKHPATDKLWLFVEKCVAFGSSVSCSHFQRVSNAIRHVFVHETKSQVTNYLDDLVERYSSAVKTVLRNDRCFVRLPIQKGLLRFILDKIQDTYLWKNQPYLSSLFKAMITMGYFGLLRIGDDSQPSQY